MPSLRPAFCLCLVFSFALLGACGNKGALVKPTPVPNKPAVAIPPAANPATNPPAKTDATPASHQPQ